jgi:hypothetical protein
MEAVVVAVSEQPHPELLIVEQNRRSRLEGWIPTRTESKSKRSETLRDW